MRPSSLLVISALFAATPLAGQEPGKVVTRPAVAAKPAPAPVAPAPDQAPVGVTVPGAPQEPIAARTAGAVVPYSTQDPFAGAFFPPEQVMQHQQELGLSAEQRTTIVNEVVKAQQRFVELQWQMQPASDSLRQLLTGSRIDEARLLQQLDQVLDLERQIKRTQIELQVRIVNTLTEAQQRQLRQLSGPKAYVPGR